MERVAFGKTGLEVTRLGLGLAEFPRHEVGAGVDNDLRKGLARLHVRVSDSQERGHRGASRPFHLLKLRVDSIGQLRPRLNVLGPRTTGPAPRSSRLPGGSGPHGPRRAAR